jgi:hypothetical protein
MYPVYTPIYFPIRMSCFFFCSLRFDTLIEHSRDLLHVPLDPGHVQQVISSAVDSVNLALVEVSAKQGPRNVSRVLQILSPVQGRLNAPLVHPHLLLHL